MRVYVTRCPLSAGIPGVVNITIGSGKGQALSFAPSKETLYRYKRDGDWELYKSQFQYQLDRIKEEDWAWLATQMSSGGQLSLEIDDENIGLLNLGCYCISGKQCHTRLLGEHIVTNQPFPDHKVHKLGPSLEMLATHLEEREGTALRQGHLKYTPFWLLEQNRYTTSIFGKMASKGHRMYWVMFGDPKSWRYFGTLCYRHNGVFRYVEKAALKAHLSGLP